MTSGPRQGVKIGLNCSFWGVFGSPKAPVAWERAPGAYLVVGACCVSVKLPILGFAGGELCYYHWGYVAVVVVVVFPIRRIGAKIA